ncbi:hypothetical protein EDC04DRAFT_2633822 [Pisolithus marmoratus]|nr:hypothetical protein EDC04DRAFT_2633822 [Pisolithus marmoratus]
MVKSLKQGKQPTLGEVKRSLKLMIKTLVTTISHMESLPKSRFGNFKLFFNENTPDDYQPPHFRAADVDSNKWFFTTHGTSETPEKMSIGNFETGWHGVSMNVTSVSSYIPSVTEDNDALFTGITNSAPKLSPVEEARLRAEDAELQRKDALDRNVVWDADGDEDAVGEETSDEGIILARYDGVSAIVPVGLRGDDGAIQPIPEASGPGCVFGQSQHTPTRVGELRDTDHMEDTQIIPATGEAEVPSLSRSPSVQRHPSLPPSDLTMSDASTPQVNTQLLEAKLRHKIFCSITSNDTETRETLSQDLPNRPGSMASSNMQGGATETKTTATAREGGFEDLDEGTLDCDCGVKIEDVCILCEGDCKRWFHIWCMGYHSPQDKRLPEQFLCLDCRLRKSSEWDIITGKIHSDIVCRFKDLALFRRAIKTFESRNPTTVKQFREQIGCTAALTSQLLARLEDEAFIATESAINDGLGSTRDIAKKTKKQARSKARKTQKELQRTKFVFLHASKRSEAYHDYFNPDPAVENRLMGLTDKIRMDSSRKGGSKLPEVLASRQPPMDEAPRETTQSDDSQTQEASQNVLMLAIARQTETTLKRKVESHTDKPTKKIKISIGTAVDLCD